MRKGKIYTDADVLTMIESHVTGAGSAHRLAKRWGVSEQYLCDVRLKRRAPGPAILSRLGIARGYVEFER